VTEISRQRSVKSMWLTLAAMTLANSMILVDQTAVPLATPEIVDGLGGNLTSAPWILTANILPLAAFMVLGGRLGDLVGLRRVFLIGAAVFVLSTALTGAAQTMAWLITMRVIQGGGAALMMPTAVAITSAVWPSERRGYALGILAGASAFFAAIGPVLGGLLTSVSWRLVFLVNVPLAVITIVITVWAVPALSTSGPRRRIDWAGAGLFAAAMVGLIYGLSQGQPQGWTAPQTLAPLIASAVFVALFVRVELSTRQPLIDFALFRRRSFLAANISQLLAGAVELGLGFLLPYYLLLVIGVGPTLAGIALIPGTLPIIAAGPLAGRLYDRRGGRIPLVAGFVVLAASGLALAWGAGFATVAAIIPGLILQGIGLGVVLTVNDPVGMNAVGESDRGEAAGLINTTEQMGGAIGIAVLSAIELGVYFPNLYQRLADRGITPTPGQVAEVHQFIVQAEEQGLRNVDQPGSVQATLHDLIAAHILAFQVTFVAAAAIALLGAATCLLLIRDQTPATTQGRGKVAT
jgi:EmrB/QacA subfamily drug resistance transporter